MSELIIIEPGKRYRFTVKFREIIGDGISSFGYDSRGRNCLLWDIDQEEYLYLDIDSTVTVIVIDVVSYNTFVCLKVCDIIES